MLRMNRFVLSALAVGLLLAGSSRAADTMLDSLKKGTPELKSAGALTFGPQGILFVADPQGAAVFAIDTEDRTAAKSTDRPKVEGIDEKIASILGVDTKQLLFNDMAVNPISGNTYLSMSRGKGADAKPAIVKVDRAGKVSDFPLKDVKFSKTTLPNAPADDSKTRKDAITCIAFAKDKLYVAGLSNEEFASKLRSIPFPFTEADKGTSIEMYHGSHGKIETASPIRTFIPFDIGGETNLLAAYTCTPLVKVPVSELKPGEKVKGVTIAELGNMNTPLDMVVYTKDGKKYILVANTARGLMKVSTDGIDKAEPITSKVAGTAGLKYETIKGAEGVVQLDAFDKEHALVLMKTKGGAYNLDTIDLP
jgi:hypothetical protein